MRCAVPQQQATRHFQLGGGGGKTGQRSSGGTYRSKVVPAGDGNDDRLTPTDILPAVPFGEQGAGDGLRVLFLSNEGRIDVQYNGSLLASEAVGSSVLRAANGSWVAVSVQYNSSGLNVKHNGVAWVQNLLLSRWSPAASWSFGLGARTGQVSSDNHWIDSLDIRVGALWELLGVMIVDESVSQSAWTFLRMACLHRKLKVMILTRGFVNQMVQKAVACSY